MSLGNLLNRLEFLFHIKTLITLENKKININPYILNNTNNRFYWNNEELFERKLLAVFNKWEILDA